MGGKELESVSPDNSFKKFCSKLKRNGGVTGGRSGVGFFLKLGKITACLCADGTDPVDSVLECLNYFQNKKLYFGVMKIFWNWIVVMAAQPCEYTKNYYYTVYFKRVDFMLCE